MSPAFVTWGCLFLAIVLETTATSCLKLSEQFTRPVPTVIMALAYAGSFYFLSITLKSLPLGIAYAIWCALGIVLVSLIGFVVFKQSLDLAACIGLGMIIGGVVVINAFSNTLAH